MPDPTFLIAAAILTIVIVRRIYPVVASVLGLILGVSVIVWGAMAYLRGATVALLGHELHVAGFAALGAVWLSVEGTNLYRLLKARSAHD